jgi:hypothetical protein
MSTTNSSGFTILLNDMVVVRFRMSYLNARNVAGEYEALPAFIEAVMKKKGIIFKM